MGFTFGFRSKPSGPSYYKYRGGNWKMDSMSQIRIVYNFYRMLGNLGQRLFSMEQSALSKLGAYTPPIRASCACR
jgi:hypothetical protein